MKQLAQRANIDIPRDVELAIARYKLLDRKTWQPTDQRQILTNRNYVSSIETNANTTEYHGSTNSEREH